MKEKIFSLFFPHDQKLAHFGALDGLRGVAVLIVLLSHTSNAGIYFHSFLNFQQIGKVGVYLFFVLSAYLLDRQIAIHLLSHKANRRYWLNYFLRRFLRIYPLFTIALIVHGLLTVLGVPTVIDHVIDIPLHLCLIRGENIFWSIPVEFKYYFISPLLMIFCHTVLRWNIRKVFFFFAGLICISISIEWISPLSRVSTLKYLPIFLTGTVLSIYELLKKELILNQRTARVLEITGILSVEIILLTIPYYFEHLFGVSLHIQSPSFYLFYAILWALVLIAAKYGVGYIKAFLSLRFLRFLGTISFSMYLFHMPILIFINSEMLSLPQEMKIYVFFISTIICSSISYVLIERPLSMIRISHGDGPE